MKSHTEYLTFNIPSKMAFQNVTPQVEAAVKKSGVKEGLVLVNTWNNSLLLNPNPGGFRRLESGHGFRTATADACGSVPVLRE